MVRGGYRNCLFASCSMFRGVSQEKLSLTELPDVWCMCAGRYPDKTFAVYDKPVARSGYECPRDMKVKENEKR